MDFADFGVEDRGSVPLIPAFRALQGFVPAGVEVSIRLIVDVELFGETEFGLDTVFSLLEAAMALNMAEFARTVPGSSAFARLGEFVRDV